jgi:hypothetical protein
MPREWRRRVIISVRMRAGASWSDASILNISSRGVMLRTVNPLVPGTTIELRKGDQRIVGRIVWRDGLRAGLCSEEILPVADFTFHSAERAAQIPATTLRSGGRRADQSRIKARLMEFGSIVLIAVCLGGTMANLVWQYLDAPLAEIGAALGG